MATKEHKECALVVKNIHSSLRKLNQQYGHEIAWSKHCCRVETLKEYAKAMEVLGTEHWEKNAADPSKMATSRISWITDCCFKYYFNGGLMKSYAKDVEIATKMNISLNPEPRTCTDILSVLDVGSCYNPFRTCSFMEVLPIDLCPSAGSGVLSCDFLSVEINDNQLQDEEKVYRLAKDTYDVVIFSLLLEYLPASEQRKLCCQKAYALLKHNGILVIITPDSKHVGANAKLMKNWRYTLALMGFSRINYEKLSYLHCMVFRKSLHPDIARRWAVLYKESYMTENINIPQDRDPLEDPPLDEHSGLYEADVESTAELFNNLPNCDY